MHPVFGELLRKNSEAYDLCQLFFHLYHIVDDVIDEEKDAQRVARLVLQCQITFTHPFFLRHYAELSSVHAACTDEYLVSIKHPDRQIADVYRHCGVNMMLAIIRIELGHERMWAVSLDLRKECFILNPNEEAKTNGNAT